MHVSITTKKELEGYISITHSVPVSSKMSVLEKELDPFFFIPLCAESKNMKEFSEAKLGLLQTSKMESFATIVRC